MYHCLNTLLASIENTHTMKNLSLISLFIAILLTGCYKKPDMYQAPSVPVVKVSHPMAKDITIYDTYTGYTEAIGKVSIVARVNGELEKRYFTPGQFVRKGQQLFQIEKEPYLSQLRRAQASVEKGKADLEVKEATYDSYSKLVKTSAVSELQYLQSKAEVGEAKAAIDKAKSDLEIAKNQYSYTKVTAPISGIISDYYVDNGNIVSSASGQQLAYIVDNRVMNIDFTIPASKFYKIQKGESSIDGLTVNVMADDNITLLGKGNVVYHDPKVDLTSGSVTLKAEVNNADHKMIDGTYVRIKLAKKNTSNVLLIPQVAIERDQVGAYVYTVKADTVEQHRVKLGSEVGENIIIESGLDIQDEIIVSGIQRARTGIKVNPIEMK